MGPALAHRYAMLYSSVLWMLKYIDDILVGQLTNLGRVKMTYHPMLLSTCHLTLLGRRTSLKMQTDFSIVIVDNFSFNFKGEDFQLSLI